MITFDRDIASVACGTVEVLPGRDGVQHIAPRVYLNIGARSIYMGQDIPGGEGERVLALAHEIADRWNNPPIVAEGIPITALTPTPIDMTSQEHADQDAGEPT